MSDKVIESNKIILYIYKYIYNIITAVRSASLPSAGKQKNNSSFQSELFFYFRVIFCLLVTAGVSPRKKFIFSYRPAGKAFDKTQNIFYNLKS